MIHSETGLNGSSKSVCNSTHNPFASVMAKSIMDETTIHNQLGGDYGDYYSYFV